MTAHEWIAEQVSDEITSTTHTLMCQGVPFVIAADVAFDAVVATLATDAPRVLAIYRQQIDRRFPGIFAHLN